MTKYASLYAWAREHTMVGGPEVQRAASEALALLADREAPRHEVQNGDGSTELISCEQFQGYVESASWYREALRSAIEEYLLWEPGRAGHAAAHRHLSAALAPVPTKPEGGEG